MVNTEKPRTAETTLPPEAARHMVLGVNPADLSETTVELLSAWSHMITPPVPVLTVTAAEKLAGWLVPVRLQETPDGGLPPDLTACMALAAARNCAYVRFDGIFAPDPALRDNDCGSKRRKPRQKER